MKFYAYILAVYFLIGSCFPNGDYTQLIRLAELGSHYRLHIQETALSGGEVSFWNFFEMHYINTRVHESNQEHDHHNLPFHQIDSSFDQIINLSLAQASLVPLKCERNQPVSFCGFYLRGFANNIFQPPIV